MQTIKAMWKAIFQNKLTIYKANWPSFVKKMILKKSLLCRLISQTSAGKPPKMAAWERLIKFVGIIAYFYILQGEVS
jgi:hypothetical protein